MAAYQGELVHKLENLSVNPQIQIAATNAIIIVHPADLK
jgi:hypothetical protein